MFRFQRPIPKLSCDICSCPWPAGNTRGQAEKAALKMFEDMFEADLGIWVAFERRFCVFWEGREFGKWISEHPSNIWEVTLMSCFWLCPILGTQEPACCAAIVCSLYCLTPWNCSLLLGYCVTSTFHVVVVMFADPLFGSTGNVLPVERTRVCLSGPIL